jgi:hypothetical protein
VNKTTIKKAGIQNKYGDMNKDENSSDDDDVQLGKQDNSSSKYQAFIYDMMTKIRQIYKVDNRVEILND